MRRFPRLTNAFSKKLENHAHAVALHMMYYNFVRIHKSLRMTPAMAAGVSTRLWEISDIVALVEAQEASKDRSRGGVQKMNSQIECANSPLKRRRASHEARPSIPGL